MPLALKVCRHVVLVAAVSAIAAVPAEAQTTAAKSPTCMSLFTAAELAQTVGPGFEEAEARESAPGETECAWMARGGTKKFQTVSVQFWDLRALAAASWTLAQAFEEHVSAAEGVATGKRELLPGVGQQAAFVPTDPQGLVIVQRADGVARVVANNVSKAQLTAVAKAIAAP